jgi:hypothetical protein
VDAVTVTDDSRENTGDRTDSGVDASSPTAGRPGGATVPTDGEATGPTEGQAARDRTAGPGLAVYRWDGRGCPASTAVVEILAEALDRDSSAMRPLYDVVDPEAFDHLFHPATGPRRRDVSVVFEYGGLEVTVCGSGEVELLPVRRGD